MKQRLAPLYSPASQCPARRIATIKAYNRLPPMAAIWLTYAWEDNKTRDVDYVAQELEVAGLQVKLDRWNLAAGRRLWEQIDEFIQDPKQSDAWLLYATQASLGSNACREEYAYALDRALHTRGADFPVIALFPASVDQTLIPTGIRTRLHVSIRDPDWKERIKAAAEGRAPSVARPTVEPFYAKMHPHPAGWGILEVRPRAGTWAPFIACVPEGEHTLVQYGPAGFPPLGCVMTGVRGGTLSHAGELWSFQSIGMEATPTMSFDLPSVFRLPRQWH